MDQKRPNFAVSNNEIIRDVARIQLATQALSEAHDLGLIGSIKHAVDTVIDTTMPGEDFTDKPEYGRLRHSLLEITLPPPDILLDHTSSSSTLSDFIERKPEMMQYSVLPDGVDQNTQAHMVIEAATAEGFSDLGLTEPAEGRYAAITWTTGAVIAGEIFKRDDSTSVGQVLAPHRRYLEARAIKQVERKRPRETTNEQGITETVYTSIAELSADEPHVFGNDPNPRYPHQIFREQLRVDFERKRQVNDRRARRP